MSNPDTKPSRLYKYCRPSVIEHVLAQKTLRFTRAGDLNDPFELFPTMDSYLRPLLSALWLLKEKPERYAQLLAHTKELIPETNIRISFERHLEETFEDENSFIVSSLRNEISDQIKKMTANERRSFLSSNREKLNNSFGILSLSEVPDSILMWSHYAGDHKGFVLELDATDPFFDQKAFPNDPLRCIQKVLYEHERPPEAHFESKHWLRTQRDAVRDLFEYMAGTLLLTKSSDWAYEQEWRMVIPLKLAREVNEGIHVLDLPPRCILRVITGSAMSDHDLSRISGILEHPDFFHVELRHVVCDTHRFHVVLKDDNSIIEHKLLQDIEQFPGDGILQRINRLQVTRPRYYEVQAALVEKGWISIPPYDRLIQKKKTLALTETGLARLAKRHEAERVWAESRKPRTKEPHRPDIMQLVEKVKSAPPEQRRSIILEDMAERVLRNQKGSEQQKIEPEISRQFAALNHEEEHVRWQAAKTLRKMGDTSIVRHLISILYAEKGDDESDPPDAYWYFSKPGWLWGSDELTRLAAYVLAGLAARVVVVEATDALIHTLRHLDATARYCAAEALGHMASVRALTELERLAQKDFEETSFGTVSQAASTAVWCVRNAQKRDGTRN